MNAVFHCVYALNEHFGPSLTWYSTNPTTLTVSRREELGGPVFARWISKIANLMGTDLADLFGDATQGRRICVDLPNTWQEIVWTLAASLMGWELHNPNTLDHSAPDIDVLVTNQVTELSLAALSGGADVLFHNTTPLALAWSGEVPEGGIDALEAIMSQPDALVVDSAEENTPLPATLAGVPLPTPTRNSATTDRPSRPLVRANLPGIYDLLSAVWIAHSGVVVVPADASAEECEHIAGNEKASLYLI